MPANMGPIDRVARLAIGLTLIAYAIPWGFPPTGWNWVGWIGVVPLAHRRFRFLPALHRRSACRPARRSARADVAPAQIGQSALALSFWSLPAAAYYWRFAREIPVRVAAPEQNVEVRVFGIGTIEAQIVSKVGFQIAGKVIAIEADQGDFVKAGALLAKLDDEAQRAKLQKSEAAQRQAAANLAKTQAQRERAEITYQQKKNVNARRQTLASRGSVSQEAAEDAQAAEEIALGDAKVIEADTRVAAVQQDDASVPAQDRCGRARPARVARAVRRASDRPPQGTRRHRECRRERCSR